MIARQEHLKLSYISVSEHIVRYEEFRIASIVACIASIRSTSIITNHGSDGAIWSEVLYAVRGNTAVLFSTARRHNGPY